MSTRKLTAISACLVLLSLTSCGTTGSSSTTSSGGSPASSSSATSGSGVVQSIDMVSRQGGGIGLGTVAGAAVGGVLGNQVGGGRGNTAATIAGAAGGAIVGQQIERNTRREDQAYRVTVRMDDGSLQTYVMDSQPNVRIGDRVRVTNGVIERY